MKFIFMSACSLTSLRGSPLNTSHKPVMESILILILTLIDWKNCSFIPYRGDWRYLNQRIIGSAINFSAGDPHKRSGVLDAYMTCLQNSKIHRTNGGNSNQYRQEQNCQDFFCQRTINVILFKLLSKIFYYVRKFS